MFDPPGFFQPYITVVKPARSLRLISSPSTPIISTALAYVMPVSTCWNFDIVTTGVSTLKRPLLEAVERVDVVIEGEPFVKIPITIASTTNEPARTKTLFIAGDIGRGGEVGIGPVAE